MFDQGTHEFKEYMQAGTQDRGQICGWKWKNKQTKLVDGLWEVIGSRVTSSVNVADLNLLIGFFC